MSLYCKIWGHKIWHSKLNRSCKRCGFKFDGYCDHEWLAEDRVVHHSKTHQSISNMFCNKCGVTKFGDAHNYPVTDLQKQRNKVWRRLQLLTGAIYDSPRCDELINMLEKELHSDDN